MRAIPSSSLIVFFILLITIELVSYFGVKELFKNIYGRISLKNKLAFLILSSVSIGILVYSFSNPALIRQSRDYSFFYFVIGLSVLNLVPKFFFSIASIISLISRLIFNFRVQQIILTGSFILSVGMFFTILFGVFIGKNQVVVNKQEVAISELPEQLTGFKIIQISDIHLGSFGKNTKVLNATVDRINSLKPDLLLFTGDIVNNFKEEMVGFDSQLSMLSAKYGKYAIMGNHDYGDYYQWSDAIEKKENLAKIEQNLTDAGFKLLLNQWDKLKIKDTSIAIIGVENWGHRPFPQYADLQKATTGMPSNLFKILMTHDPAHWDAVVVPKTDIPLTLSGHTHGGQFGIKIAGIEFSPMYLIQKRWGGLYQSENQQLYVNRGLGTIGFPGRIEMYPEITLITLSRTKSH